jgi:hypothetical protein
LCINANRTELAPIVFDGDIVGVRNPSEDWASSSYFENVTSDNFTVLDEVFDWRGLPSDVVFGEWWSDVAHARPGMLLLNTHAMPTADLDKVFSRFPGAGETVSSQICVTI